MKARLENYGYSKDVLDIVRPIVSALERGDINGARMLLGKLALRVSEEVPKRILNANDADKYFTLLDLYLGDHFPSLNLGEDIKNLLFEGMILHDYGKDYGANLDRLKQLALQITGTL